MLAATHVPTPPNDQRRLDLIVLGLNVERGLPLFCDVTAFSPTSGSGDARSGASDRGGRLLEIAEEDNDKIYKK